MGARGGFSGVAVTVTSQTKGKGQINYLYIYLNTYKRPSCVFLSQRNLTFITITSCIHMMVVVLVPTLGANIKSLLAPKFGSNTAPFHFAIKRRLLCLPDSEKPDTSITDRITHLGSVSQKLKITFMAHFCRDGKSGRYGRYISAIFFSWC